MKLARVWRDIYWCDQPYPENALRIDMCALPMISLMERNGMRIDRGRIEELHGTLTREMEELAAQVQTMTGYSINLASGPQLAELLYEKMGLRQQGKEKWTKSKERLAADSDVLKGMISQHPVIKVILEWKVREKLRSTYTHSLLAQMDERGYVHPDINHVGTDTGRYACSSPNLQNIPTRTPLGKLVRSAFIPPDGHVFGTCDLSQIEMRHAGEDAKCPSLMAVFKNGEDLYWAVAESIFRRKFTKEDRKTGIDPKTGLTLKEAFRTNAKVVALGTIYDISSQGLVDQLLAYGAIPFLTDGKPDWDYDRDYEQAVLICDNAIRSFFESYPELLHRRAEHHRRAFIHGMVWDCFGRIRFIPQVKSCHQWVQGEGLRAGGNMPIQGACAGMLKLWLGKIYERYETFWRLQGIRPTITVHDEVIASGPESAVEDWLQETADIVKNLMPPECYETPLKSSTAIAGDWGSLEK